MADFIPLLVAVFVVLMAGLLARPDSDRIGGVARVRTLKYGWRFRTFVLIFLGCLPVISVVSYVNGNPSDVAELVALVLLNLLALGRSAGSSGWQSVSWSAMAAFRPRTT